LFFNKASKKKEEEQGKRVAGEKMPGKLPAGIQRSTTKNQNTLPNKHDPSATPNAKNVTTPCK